LTNLSSEYLTTGLPAQLKTEGEALRSFISLLETEQQALVSQDSDKLMTLAESKSQAANKISELSTIRRQQLKLGSSELDTTAWIKQHAPACTKAWNDIVELATRAHHINHVNGEVIQLRLRSNQKALSVLLSAAQNAAGIYGRDGQPNLPLSGRTLGNV
jgi:flagellar biosynthesis/type III secretory pathway chaperone